MGEFSVYDTAVLTAAVERIPENHTFLLDTFFKNTVQSENKKVMIDIRKGNRKVAPFVHRAMGGKIVENTGFKTLEFEPELVAPCKVTTAADVAKRQFGEELYGIEPAEVRAVKKLVSDFAELDGQITRREELMAAQELTTGQAIVKGEGLDYIVDFNLTNKETITTDTSKWSDQTNSSPLDDIARYKKAIQKSSGANADVLILGDTALSYFLANEKVQAALDVKNIELAAIQPEQLPNGATYIGKLRKEGISIYSYNCYYLDDWSEDEPVDKPMIPDNTLILGATNNGNRRAYAAIDILDEESKSFVTVPKSRVPETFVKRHPSRVFAQLNSAPLPVLAEPDAFFSAVVC